MCKCRILWTQTINMLCNYSMNISLVHSDKLVCQIFSSLRGLRSQSMLLQRYTHDLSLVSCINVLINWLFTFSWVLKASISSSLALVSLSTASSCSLSCCLLVSFCSTAFCRDDRLSPEDTNTDSVGSGQVYQLQTYLQYQLVIEFMNQRIS